jgi:hypothetical protein
LGFLFIGQIKRLALSATAPRGRALNGSARAALFFCL